MATILTKDAASEAMVNGLISCIREELRARIMERIEPDITAAIDVGLEAFKATIETYKDPVFMRDVVRVVIEKSSGHR